MNEFLIMLRNVCVFVALALPGFILVKTKQLKAEKSGVLSKLLIYIGMPFLIITSTMDKVNFNESILVAMGLVAGISILYTIVMFFISKPITSMEKEEKKRGMMRFCTIFSNNGFLGIPLAVAVFGGDSVATMLLIIVNIITNIFIYTLGVYLASGDKSTISLKKALSNPVLIAFVIGIVLKLLNVKAYIPEISTFSTHFYNLVTPISMTILGMKMGSINFTALFKSWKTYYVALWKLIIFPCAIVAILMLAKILIGDALVTNDIITSIFISFAVPTAGLASTFSDSYNGDTEGAVAYTLGSTVLSVLTIPILYGLLCWIL